MDIRELTRDNFLMFDGALGTMLMQRGLMPSELPELLNLSHPDLVSDIHREYVDAGSDIVSTNTFQANELKLGHEHSVEEVVHAGVMCARKSKARYVAFSIGPLGQLMEPMGTVSFERAYQVFERQVKAGVAAKADLILIETMSDPYEAKAAILAAKENSSLPVICSMTFQQDERTFVGCDALTATMTLQGLGVDALGVNCSLEPSLLAPIVKVMLRYSHIPVILQANAGLPVIRDSKAVYELSAQDYADQVMPLLEQGVRIIGGCCGTTPEHISVLRKRLDKMKPARADVITVSACTCATRTVILDGQTTEIGERLNPTGKKKMQEALRTGDKDYLVHEAVSQVSAGAAILDINVGLPELDEPHVLSKTVKLIQEVSPVPLQIDSADPQAIEAAVRIYNGKPIINSVNGKREVMQEVFPIAKKYGALVIGLTLDEEGIPPTANGRLKIARRILETASSYGIPRQDIIIDCLVLTASAQQSQVKETLKAISLVKSELGLKTVLGVSNVSFGLPCREPLNATFLAASLGAGLDAAIINPLSARYREVLYAYRVLSGEDKNAVNFIKRYADFAMTGTPENGQDEKLSLAEIISQGRKDRAASKVRELLADHSPLHIIDSEFIPALERVGERFEKGEIFLPQLMLCAQTVQNGFTVIRKELSSGEKGRDMKEKILLATVSGDIHDIGKNIVKMLLENYGYEIIDLGKDVPAEDIVSAVRENDIRLVGLSALMTTTVKNMKETISLVRESELKCSFMVGGAVLNSEYARYVGADFYAKSATDGVSIANRFFASHS